MPDPATAKFAARGWWVAAVALSGSWWPLSATAQSPSCPSGRIERVEIHNNSLFSPDEIQGRPFPWALRAANGAHIRTRADYIRRALLVAKGACYDAEALAASIRNLRGLGFIARAKGSARQQEDSTWVVRVETWDEWSTHPSFDVTVDRVVRFQGFSITETNALGLGTSVAFRQHRFREHDDQGFFLGTNRFLGTQDPVSVSAGTTRTGHYFGTDFAQPFLSEASRVSLRAHFQYTDREQSWFTGDNNAISNLVLPISDRSASLIALRQFGTPGAITSFGGEVQFLRRTISGAALQVFQQNFDHSTPATDTLAAQLRPQTSPNSYLRIGATGGLRHIRFTEAKGLDLISGVQDVALGSDVTATVGRTIATFGTSKTDTYGRLDGYAARMAGLLLGTVQLHAEARYLDASTSDMSRWQDLWLAGRVLMYAHPPSTTTQTFVTGVKFNLRDNVDQPWQGALGSDDAVRGYDGDALPTGNTVVGFAEERVNLPVIYPAVDLGLTAFGDYGRGWIDNVPLALNTGWRSSVGGGLRVGFPASTGAVMRIELAWPVKAGSLGGPVFRVYWSTVTTRR